jgi:type II secretory pathway component PulF
MIGCMDQEAPRPNRLTATPPNPLTPVAPLLEYGPRPEAGMRVGEYLAHFIASAVLVVVVLVALHWGADRMKHVYADFGLRLPRATQLLLDVSDASRACYGWVLLAIVPFAAPFVLTRMPPATRRWVATLAILLTGLFFIFAIFAMFEPMVTLMGGVSGKR